MTTTGLTGRFDGKRLEGKTALVTGAGGGIVNTASQWGLYPAPGHIAYNVSKAAVVEITGAQAVA
jgi:NAD(P)-dependent dehydrogenase (short-subunit alcohol dehydrogenase family)